MTAAWWIAGHRTKPRLAPGPGPFGLQPELMRADAASLQRELLERIGGFTPEWSNRTRGDAGMALVQLYSELASPVAGRLNRIPEKYLIEFLRIANVSARTASVSEVTVQFEVAPGAPRSMLIPQGFQIAGNDAETNAVVIYETQRTLHAAPGSLGATITQQGRFFVNVPNDGQTPFLPFGKNARPGRAVWFGLESNNPPGPFLTLGVELAPEGGVASPVAAGGITPAAPGPAIVLAWEVLNGSFFSEAELVRDGTAGLTRSGTIEIKLPREWKRGSPPGSDAPELFWLRFRLVFGRFPRDPKFLAVRLNAVEASAARTFRDEVMEALPTLPTGQARMRVAQVPVVDGSLVLEVEEGGVEGSAEALSEGAAAPLLTNARVGGAGAPVRWTEVVDLALYGPEDSVYTFDALTGVATFGDGRFGRALPEGFRHVRAVRYQTPSPAEAPPEPESVKTMISSAPFVTGVSNSQRGTGGLAVETMDQILRRGPEEIRARGRAVTTADYALMATRLPNALVSRAHAVGAFHPGWTGRPLPGVVTVFVVPPERNEGPPVADEATLRAVAEGLSETAALTGVEIVAAPVNYVHVAVEATVVVDPAADTAETIRNLLDALDRYLHPLTGGGDGAGFPFGGAVLYDDLLRVMLAVANVLAAPRLNLRINSVRQPSCRDYPLPPNMLPWPEGHEIIPIEQEERL